jgi:hypothetical protein
MVYSVFAARSSASSSCTCVSVWLGEHVRVGRPQSLHKDE